MSRNLSQIVADLFARPLESRELSSQIQRLGDEIRKVFHSEDTMSGRFLGLLESFRAIIPDEKQRYQAVLQALSTTTKLSRQDIIQAINSQLVELKIVENSLMPTQQAWRDALKGTEVRSQQVKGEMEQLRARLAQLENEERSIQTGMAAQEKDLALAEKTVKDLFANIAAEIGSLNKKVLDLTSEASAAQTAPLPVQPTSPVAEQVPAAVQPVPTKERQKSDVTGKKKSDEQKIEIQGAAPPQETKFQRKCPMCGGPFNLLELENIWQCYTCAHEEPNTGRSSG